jgi:hypothetical protein
MRAFLISLPLFFTVFFLASCSDSSNVTNPPASSDLFSADTIVLRSNAVYSINSEFKLAKLSKINISYEGQCDVTPADSLAGIHINVLIGAANDTGAFVSYNTIYNTISPTEFKKGFSKDFDVSTYDPNLGLKFEMAFTKNAPGQTRTIKFVNLKGKKVS